MRAAVLTSHGVPAFGDFPEPVAGAGQLVRVAAAALSHLDVARAAGTFYTGPPPLPSVAGGDGVGHLPDGRRVYFDTTIAPYGSMAQATIVPEGTTIDVPASLPDTEAAVLGNAGLAAWLSLQWRAALGAGETVLVLGATGVVGRLAVQAARLQGAGRVVAAGRDLASLAELTRLGADAVVDLASGEPHVDALAAAADGGVDVVVDLLWGAPALAALAVAAPFCRHVQLGHLAGASAAVPAACLRSAPVTLMGYANFHAPFQVRAEAFHVLGTHAAAGDLGIEVDARPLADVAMAWVDLERGSRRKIVLMP